MRKLLKLLLVIVFSFTLVYAADYGEVDRTTLENHGVNKHWNINENNLPNVLRTPYVDSSIKVYDYANIISESDRVEIKSKIDAFQEKTKMEFIVLTISEPYTDKQNEDYAADFYDYNDFGLKDGTKDYSGVIFIVNMHEESRFFNIYTFGQAQLYYPYSTCESMLDYIWDDFKAGTYSEGIKKMIDRADFYYGDGTINSNYYVDDNGFLQKKYVMPVVPAVGAGLIVTIIVMVICVKKNKMVKKATKAGDYFDKNSINYAVKTDQFVGTFTTRHRMSSDSSGGGGGHSSMGSSGGGHGGGGGRHF